MQPWTGANYDDQLISDKIDAATDIEEFLDALDERDRLRSEAATLAGGEAVMKTPNIGGTAQQLQRTSKKRDIHDQKLVNSDDIDQDVGVSPAGKRVRQELESSAPWPNAASRPQLPSTAFGSPNAFPPPQPGQADLATSKLHRSTLPAFTGAPQSLPVNKISHLGRLSNRLDDSKAASQSRETLNPFSALRDSAMQLDTASINTPILTGRDNLAGLSPAFGSNIRTTPHQRFDPQLPLANQQNDPPLLSTNQQIVQQTTQQTVQQPQRFQRPPPRRIKFHGQNEIKSFPARREALPPNLTLEQICWNYPNHLIGARLRPFIEAGWTATMMWDAMQDSAKGTSAKKRPWNKLEHRLLNEMKRMANAGTAVNEEEDDDNEEETGSSREKTPGSSSITQDLQDMEESRGSIPAFSLAAEQGPGIGDVVSAAAPEVHRT